MTPLAARWVLALAALAGCGGAFAQSSPGAADRRAEIAAERAAVEKRYADQEAACRERFVVTSCLDDARAERRAALAPLRQEELRIDTEERKQRAAARLGDIESKQRAEAARDAASAAESPRPASEPQNPPRPAGRIGGGPARPVPGAEERARLEAESEAKFQRRQEDAARHRADVEARNAERAAKGKVPKPLLPAPGASMP